MDYHFVRRNKPFTMLWGAQMLSATAQHLLNFALIILVYGLAQGTRFANISVALVVLSYGIPSVLFASVAGVFVDHWDRRRVMLVTNLLRAALVLGFFVFRHNLILLFATSFVIASVTQFFAPAEAASIPALVKEPDLLAANALFVLSFYATFVLGYSVSAPIMKLFGTMAPFGFAVVMFATAALLSLGLPALKAKEALHQRITDIFAKTWHELSANTKMIFHTPKLFFPILQLASVQAVLGTILTLAPAIALTVLGAQLTDVSQFLIVPAGLGMVFGVLGVGLITRLLHNKLTVVRYSAFATALVLLALGLATQLHLLGLGYGTPTILAANLTVAVLVLSLGAGNAILSTTAQTILQENTTDTQRGKVFGSLNMVMNLASTLPVLVAATLADAFGVAHILVAVGVLLTVLAGWQLVVINRPAKVGLGA